MIDNQKSTKEKANHRMLWKQMGCGLLFVICMVLTLLRPARADKQIRLTFTGDVTLGSEEALKDEEDSFVSFAQREGFDYFLEQVKPLFEQDDLTIVNLEGVLSDSSDGENKEKTYRFRGPMDFAKILSGSSVEAANLANNHAHDFGEGGYADTKTALDREGVLHFGGEETLIFEKDGIRIGFVGMSYTEETRRERERVQDEIRRLKEEEGVSAVIFCYHGGREYSKGRTQKQMDVAKTMIRAGADLVIMHHPHVVEGMSRFYNRSVCYSLGNFCFGGNKRVKALESLVVCATLHFSDDGVYLGQQLELHAAHTSGTKKKSNFQPYLVSGDEARKVFRLVRDDTRYKFPPLDEEKNCVVLDYLPAE